MKISKIILLSIVFLTTSCVEAVIIGSVGGGVVATREKSLKDTRSDVAISATLGFDFVTHGLRNPGNSVNFTVNEGRVLLTGIVRNRDKIQLARDVSWNALGVKEVIDEIQIRDNEKLKPKDFVSSFYDYLITTQVEAKLLVARDVFWPNYKITTVGGVVYLLGIAKNDFEMQRALTITSKVRGVERVVNHVLLRDDPRRNG
jgi:osmotically-inducible protein OsmY